MKKTTHSPTPTIDLYQKVTDRIIAALENGLVPWHKPWSAYGLPANHFSRHIYQGINSIMLTFGDYEYPFWATFKQVSDAGGHIRKGAKSEQVYFFKYLYWDEQGRKIGPEQASALMDSGVSVKRKRYIQYSCVFNVADFVGIEVALPPLPTSCPTERATRLLQALPQSPNIVHTFKDRACYLPSSDRINMPYQRQFDSAAQYYATLFHELIHWTGHASRLNRLESVNFNSDPYAKEELVAEIGASFLCALTGIQQPETEVNSAVYLQNWMAKLQGDKELIFNAASTARKAVAFLMQHSEVLVAVA